ncbi:MAG: hypothetical protein KAR32_12790 [Candidatus Omnitrophica bacterium]|nr:hypothetical protein [Candidatus Omnitrophota bacterium]
MKRAALLAVALLFTATMAQANCGMFKLAKGKKSEDWVQKSIERMTEKLGLTEDQVPQVEALVKEKAEKKKAVKEECRAKTKIIRDEYSAKIKSLLNEEQQKKFDECKKEREEEAKEMKGKRGEGYGHGPGPECKFKKGATEDKGSEDGS